MKVIWGYFTLVLSVGTKALYKSPSRDTSPSLLSHSLSHSSRSDTTWLSLPSSGLYSTAGFGGSTNPSGSDTTYVGNVGRPYGSNILEVSSSEASQYEYVVQFVGPNTDGWKVVIWNTGGRDGGRNGWYGNACKSFTLAAGQVKYIAFAADSQGGWAAAKASSIPTDQNGGYASTWGEFNLGTTENSGWSGFDVSMIQAQNAKLEVQGMKICSLLSTKICSYITEGATVIHNAYTSAETDIGGIGGNLYPGPVRLVVNIGYGN
ncbi:hypothetical protein N7476_005143 [Penicillium atrosanguineum]|uniref:Allergen Asp f 4 n=1 Tax=Penicillium atrosanguineum TaxID=1132637 RepID=A0A9W9PYU6_9EURO|nr:hypothetical protein N7476_005143 [Penicillium atrosanguineum]